MTKSQRQHLQTVVDQHDAIVQQILKGQHAFKAATRAMFKAQDIHIEAVKMLVIANTAARQLLNN